MLLLQALSNTWAYRYVMISVITGIFFKNNTAHPLSVTGYWS